MATPSIQGLFGGMGTPEEMQQQAVNQKAMQFAQMSPQQQTSYNIYKNTGNLGRGLAGAMGVDVQDPAVRRATMLRQLASQFDTSTPEGLKQMAQAVQGTDPELGYQIMQRAQEMEKTTSETELKKAQATKALSVKETTSTSERNRKLISDAEVKLVGGEPLTNAELANLRWLVAQETKVKTFQDPDTREIVRIEPIDLSQAAPNLFKQLVQAPATSVGAEGTSPAPQGQQQPPAVTGAPAATYGGGKVTTIATPASIAKEAAATEAKDTAIARLDEGLINIGQAMKLMESPTANPWISSWTENFPTDARALSNVVTSLKSQKTIDLINQMKNASKTGATGFGSVTEKELDLLQSDIVKLDQRSPTFKEDLKRLQTTWTNLQNKIKSSQAGGKTPTPSAAPNANLDAKVAKFMAANPTMSREAVIEQMKKTGHYK
jgi:protein gp37